MSPSRRDFLKTLSAVPLALSLNPTKVAEKKTLLPPPPKEITHKLLREDWYDATVVDVVEQPSRTRPNQLNYGVTLRLDDGQEVVSWFSDLHPFRMIGFLVGVKMIDSSRTYEEVRINLEDTIGKKLRVYIETREYGDKKYNHIEEYLAPDASQRG